MATIQRRPAKGKGPGGRVQFIVRYYDPAGRARSKTFSNLKYPQAEKAARTFAADTEKALLDGTWHDPTLGQVTMATLAAAWTAQAETAGTTGVRTQLERNLGDLAALPVARVTAPAIRTWVGHMRHGRPWRPGCTGLSENTVSSQLSQLKAMLTQAVGDGLIPANPAAAVSVPRPPTTVTWLDLPTVDELTEMIRVARDGGRKKRGADGKLTWVLKDPSLALALHVGAATGMRPGEVAGLTWAAVDEGAQTIRVIAQADETGVGLRELKTKRAGRRTVAVDAGTLELLRAHRKAQAPHERVFLNSRSRPWAASVFAHKFAHLRDYLGLRESLTPNSLRHFHATQLLRAGVPVKTVQHRLGHASSQLTHDVYTHFMPADDAAAAAAVAGILAGRGSIGDQGGHLRAV